MKQPHWPLPQVKELAAAGQIWVQKTRAAAYFATPVEAVRVAKEVVAALQISSFSGSAQLTQDIADVYGVVLNEDEGWFLKICIDEAIPELLIISLHPLERPLSTNGGVVKP